MKTLALVLVSLVAADAARAAVVEQQTVRQRWPFSRVIDVDYVLSADPEEVFDVRPTFYDGDTQLDVGAAALSGQFACVSDGSHRMTVDLSKSALQGIPSLSSFRVVLTPVESPLYMIVDIRRTNDAAGPRVTYLTRTDLLSGRHGACETDLSKLGIANCSLKNPIVWTGCTNDLRFVSTHMLFRRILPGSFVAAGTAADAPNVSVSSPYWMAVFEFTVGHRVALSGTSLPQPLALEHRRPVFNISTTDVRGSIEEGVNWPETGTADVGRSSLLGLLRDTTGVLFDIPTEAQWELAYRAGTTTEFYTGTDDGSAANAIGRNNSNGGFWDNGDGNGKQWHPSSTEPGWPSEGYAPAGYYAPNAYGLYDMSGNVEEVCLDWIAAATSPSHLGTDPVGPKMSASTDPKRVARGGSAWHTPAATGVGQRQGAGHDERSSLFGFRFIVLDGLNQN